MSENVQILCCYQETIDNIKQHIEKLNSLSCTIYPKVEALQQKYETVYAKYMEKDERLKLELQNEHIYIDLDEINGSLNELEHSITEVKYTEDNDTIEKCVQLLEDVEERLATIHERFNDVIRVNGLTEKNIEKKKELSER